MKKISVFILFILLVICMAPCCYAKQGDLKGYIIVLDPGHGGYDPGTIKDGTMEKNINLQVSLKVRKLLEKHGATVVMTRNNDAGLAERVDGEKSQRLELGKRLDIAKANNADLFISIHVNGVRLDSCSGAEVFYSPRSERSRALAEEVQDQLLTIPQMTHRYPKPSDYFVLENSHCVSILIELGFLSNPIERSKLTDHKYQDLLAEKIAAGINIHCSKLG